MRDSIAFSRRIRFISAAFSVAFGMLVAASACSKRDADDAKGPPESAPGDSMIDVSQIAPPKVPPPKVPQTDVPLDETRHQFAEFMGTRARGQRFCIIADASNSMKGAPLAQLKTEILQTLDGLKPPSAFYIILFNATDISMPHPTWLYADKESVDKVRPWVQNISLALHTKPTSAFERAFKLQPKPDVIFFMTDGFLQGFSPDQVTRLNATEPKVAVHTIRFASGKATAKAAAKNANAAATQLRTLAENNGGTFRTVNQK